MSIVRLVGWEAVSLRFTQKAQKQPGLEPLCAPARGVRRHRVWLMACGPTCPSFLVSVLYSKAKLASACGGIIYFLSYVPYMYVAIREEVAHDKITAFEKCIAVRVVVSRAGWGGAGWQSPSPH